MVKKSIIAIALLGMLSTVTFGQLNPGTGDGQLKYDNGWPKTCIWTQIEICCIKVNLKIGYFIEVLDCSKKSINMVQVNCPAGATPAQTFPCYKGCTTISVRANFNATIGLALHAIGSIINDNGTQGNPNDDKWKAYFQNGGDGITINDPPTTANVTGDGNLHTIDVCVEAWDANIFGGTPGQNPQVGTVCITAVPTAAATCP